MKLSALRLQQLLLNRCQECPDGIFIAAVECPLTVALGLHQSDFLQQTHVVGDCGLRQPGLLLNVADAHAFQPGMLGKCWRKIRSVLEPAQDLTTNRVIQCCKGCVKMYLLAYIQIPVFCT